VWDSPNSAGVVIDAVRCIKLALDRGVGGPLVGPSAYFMKSPPVQYSDGEARDMVEDFIAEQQTRGVEVTGHSNGHGPVSLDMDPAVQGDR
jgi:myo-inositol-1-phosphate synthase